ncbi:MAG: hypothetical protein R6V46_10670 [Desulfatiglandaceae bacterium]
MKVLSDDLIKKIVGQYIKDSIKMLDQSFYEEWDESCPPPQFGDAQTFHSYVDSLGSIRESLIVNLNLGDFSILENVITSLTKKNEIKQVDDQSPLYRKLCVEIHKAEIKLIPLQQRQMMCDFSYRDEVPDIFPEVFPRAVKSTATEGVQESEVIEKVMESFWQEREPNWKKRTAVDYRTCRDHLVGFLGSDTQIHTVSYQQGRDYKRHRWKKVAKKENHCPQPELTCIWVSRPRFSISPKETTIQIKIRLKACKYLKRTKGSMSSGMCLIRKI